MGKGIGVQVKGSKVAWLILILALVLALQPLSATRIVADGGGGTEPPGKTDTTNYGSSTSTTHATSEVNGELGGWVTLWTVLDIAF